MGRPVRGHRYRTGGPDHLHELVGLVEVIRRRPRRSGLHLFERRRRPPWALAPDEAGRSRGDQVLFFPDQHLGRNTGFQLGYRAEDMAVWNPRLDRGGLDSATLKSATLLLWKGHCSVHQRFSTAHVEAFRQEHPEGIVVAHPECAHDVVEVADLVGSTDFIIRAVADAPPVRSSASAPRSTW